MKSEFKKSHNYKINKLTFYIDYREWVNWICRSYELVLHNMSMQWINAAKYRILISISIRAYSYPSEKTALNGHIDRYLYTFGFDSTTFSIHRLIYGCPFISCDCDCFETFGFFRYTDFNLNRKTYHTLLNMLYFKPWAHLSGIHFYRILFCLVFSESKGNWKYTWNFEQTNKFELLFQYMF